ncbi:MmcQ/YjbR family DNA-binding protein [Tessaracoccus antarcticus]|uniref:MmcQ/YjbR family DNA-binding protein n=1 Tax=Tessaracoccus antarcticus TaxID=2479848 RepID=A0A3M0G1J5_9ACTN|nr:MmcQ/YjbR family DNA-binding protein [Tessaracoccus antarcticus]RMB58850.1 MmcQ/YjbR family DNA-binding protein [Tessaracoccus antarcticus]
MEHPRMFSDDDPVLARVRMLALALPDAQEKVGHGRPTFYTTKVFAYFGGSLKVDGEWIQHPQSIMVKLDEDEREALLSEDRVYVPGYLGSSGWIGVDIDEGTDFAEIAELLETSYRQTAPRTLVGRLDQRPGNLSHTPPGL